MAIRITTSANTRPRYAGCAIALEAQAILFGGFRCMFAAADAALDHAILSIRTATNDNAALQIFRDDVLGGVLDCMRVTISDAAGNVAAANSATGTVAANDVWHTVVWAVELLPSNQARVSLWFDGGSVITATATHNHSGTFAFDDDDIYLGGRLSGSTRMMNGTLEGVFIGSGHVPTAGEVLALQTQMAHVVFAGHATATLRFNADLTRSDLHDRISEVVPTYVTKPVRSLMPGIDYGRGLTIPILGDPQFWGAIEVADPGDTPWLDYADWVDDYAANLNFDQILCVGDWVDLATDAGEWVAARAGVDAIVAAGVSIFGPPGNHDLENAGADSRGTVDMQDEDHLPPSLFEAMDGWAEELYGELEVGTDVYTYATLIGDDWLIIHLPFACTVAQLARTRACAARYPNRKVIINTHAFLNSSGALYLAPYSGSPSTYTAFDNDPAGPATDPGGDNGWWATCLSYIPNLAVVCGGHDTASLSTKRTANLALTGRFGNSVLALMVNYQTGANGGQGLMTFLEIDGANIRGESYHALDNTFYDGTGNSFDYEIEGPRPPQAGGLRLGIGIGF